MPVLKSSGKKQTPMPGPNSSVYKKLVAANKAAKKAAEKAAQNPKKRRRSSGAFSSLKSRQMLVERVKREIWASVLAINDAIICLALCGDYNAAKGLFDFAGVYSLPTRDDENPATAAAVACAPAALASAPAPAPESRAEEASEDPVDLFFRTIGVRPLNSEPEPAAASSL